MKLRPYQLEGAAHLAFNKKALLADSPRVGKTAAAIRACDWVNAKNVLWLTTGSAREAHAKAWGDTQDISRPVVTGLTGKNGVPDAGVFITSYALAAGSLKTQILARKWDAVVLDEAHYLKDRGSQRTKAVYGKTKGTQVRMCGGFIENVENIFLLSGTIMPNNPSELWTHLRALAPERIKSRLGRASNFWQFTNRFCVVRNNGFGMQIEKGRNLPELRKRLTGFAYGRTMRDVRPQVPDVQTELLCLSDAKAQAELIKLEREPEWAEVANIIAKYRQSDNLAALWADLRKEKQHVAKLRRLVGMAKISAAVEWCKDHLVDGGKLVVFAHHRDVVTGLRDGLKVFNPVVLMGGTSAGDRQGLQEAFQSGERRRVFIGNIKAAGEAIDLSAADEALFVEGAWVPGDLEQASFRIVNVNKTKPTFARFATLAGSIDEQLQAACVRKIHDITQVMGTEDEQHR